MSRRSLYEISEDLALVEQALVDTSDPDGIASLERYLAELAVERERKLDAYCGLIREIEARSQARAAEADRLRELARIDRSAVERLKEGLLQHFVAHDLKRVETERFRITRAKSGGRQPLELDPVDSWDLPEQYTKITIEPDKEAIRTALESGEELPWARLTPRGEHLRIA